MTPIQLERGKSKWRVAVQVALVISLAVFLLNPSHFSRPRIFAAVKKPYHQSYNKTSNFSSSSSRKNPLVLAVNFSSSSSVSQNSSSESDVIIISGSLGAETASSCSGVKRHLHYANSCEYAKAHGCRSGGIIDYIGFFYCTCGRWPPLGYFVLSLWLVALIYMLGNTAAEYFCPSLSTLAHLLKLSPTVAGVTLLPFGNGASDFFSSIAAIVSANTGNLALNSILGGGVFITTVVVGSISLIVARSEVTIDRVCFIRDVCFYLFALATLWVILVIGKISFVGALAFLSIYVIYAAAVAGREYFRKNRECKMELFCSSSHSNEDALSCPLLLDPEEARGGGAAAAEEEDEVTGNKCKSYWKFFLDVLELPLLLPRRLTIPVIEETRWSRGYTIMSCMLSPVLLTYVCSSQETNSVDARNYIYFVALFTGSVLAIIVWVTTKAEQPPQKFVFPLIAAGFLMSVVWFYILANEFVMLLNAVGVILGLSPSILGLTVMAWGNSVGDLIANVTLAMNNGDDGVQIALSGCYAAPMFNTLVALGTALVMKAWIEAPAFVIPEDDSLFYTLGFLVASLLWALAVLPNKGMRPSKLLGLGLLALYASFMSFRLIRYTVHVSNGSGR